MEGDDVAAREFTEASSGAYSATVVYVPVDVRSTASIRNQIGWFDRMINFLFSFCFGITAFASVLGMPTAVLTAAQTGN